MKVTDLSLTMVSSEYKYLVHIPPNNLSLLNDVIDWANEHNIQCTLIPGTGYFKYSEDVTMFILRWS